ncbi:hypothetical protein P3S67_004349 [Capsicum chacoense]
MEELPTHKPINPMHIDPTSHVNTTFLEKLKSNPCFPTLNDNDQTMAWTTDLEDETSPTQPTDNFIPITAADKHRLYLPWKYVIIIKLVGLRMDHQLLKTKLLALWKPAENFTLIDLGADFFLIKFTKEENMNHVLHEGPWFVFNLWLSVQKWKPKFVSSQAKIAYSAIWVRLPELPTEFYDLKIFLKVGSKIGTLLKIDSCTSSTTKGRYARLCLEVPLEQSLLPYIYIDTHKQIIH